MKLARNSAAEIKGAQKFLFPDPFPFCPPERKIKNSFQKKFKLQNKNNSRTRQIVIFFIHYLMSFQTSVLVGQAWGIFKRHILFVWLIFGVVYGGEIFFTVLTTVYDKGLLAVLGFHITTIVSIALNLGLIRVMVDLVSTDTESDLKKLFPPMYLFWRFLGASLLYGMVTSFGFLLFIIPGIYFVLKYQFYGYLIVEKNLGIREAFEESARMTKGIKWRLIWFSLVMVGINILGAFFFVIGLAVSIPVTSLAYVYLYRVLSKESGEASPVVETVIAETKVAVEVVAVHERIEPTV